MFVHPVPLRNLLFLLITNYFFFVKSYLCLYFFSSSLSKFLYSMDYVSTVIHTCIHLQSNLEIVNNEVRNKVTFKPQQVQEMFFFFAWIEPLCFFRQREQSTSLDREPFSPLSNSTKLTTVDFPPISSRLQGTPN